MEASSMSFILFLTILSLIVGFTGFILLTIDAIDSYARRKK